MKKIFALASLMFALPAAAAPATLRTQGVTKHEVVIGTLQDLSGPIAAYGKAIRNGLLLWADEVNEQGGVHGRKVRVVVDDTGYDLKKAVLAARKQVEKDKVFVSAANLGTAVALAAMPVFVEHDVPHLFPLSAARQMYEPLHPLKYSFAGTYFDQMRALARYLTAQRAERKWCVFHQDDDFGLEVLQGVEAGLKEGGGRALVEKTSFKRNTFDFTSQVQKMRSAGCDTVVAGAVAGATARLLIDARRFGLQAQFAGSSGAYSHLLPALAGPVADGLIAAHTVAHPYLDDASDRVRFWATKYRTRFNDAPDVYSVYGYLAGELLGAALAKAGPNLTTDSLVRALDSLAYVDPLFGSDRATFSPNRHLSGARSRFSEIRGGRWVVVSDYVEP